MKLTCMRGHSGSGKSTKAAEIAKETGAVIVNRDQIRKMLLNEWWTGKKADEDRVTVAEEATVNALLRAGIPVVVDSTHLHSPYLRKWARLATRLAVDYEVVDVHATIDTCKRRDHARMLAGERYVGDVVIDRQGKQWPVEKWPTVTADRIHIEPYVPKPGTPEAIIVDIDGTLAHIPEGGRSPYDYSRVSEDEVDHTIRDLVNVWGGYDPGRKVLMVSGRDSCWWETLKWLQDQGIKSDSLWTRDAGAKDSRGNKLPDYIVKLNIFNVHIRDNYNVRFVLDDRDQVVEMWRRLGLTCLQVAPGDF